MFVQFQLHSTVWSFKQAIMFLRKLLKSDSKPEAKNGPPAGMQMMGASLQKRFSKGVQYNSKQLQLISIHKDYVMSNSFFIMSNVFSALVCALSTALTEA